MAVERVRITPDYDWLAAREGFVGASEVATVCGIAGAYQSLAELYAKKKRLIAGVSNTAMLRGRWLEPGAFQALADTHPLWLVTRARIHLLDHERRIAATPDGYAIAPGRPGIGIVEAKVVSQPVFRRWLRDPDDPYGAAQVPELFRAQIVTQLMLEGPACPWAVLAVLVVSEFGAEFHAFDIAPDPALEQQITEAVRDFFERYFDPGIAPPYDPLVDQELIKELFPKDDGTTLDLSTDNRALAATDDWVKTAAERLNLEKHETVLKTELIGKLGNHTFGLLADGRRLSWKQTIRHEKARPAREVSSRTLKLIRAQESTYETH